MYCIWIADNTLFKRVIVFVMRLILLASLISSLILSLVSYLHEIERLILVYAVVKQLQQLEP
jgi:hypothetical protein